MSISPFLKIVLFSDRSPQVVAILAERLHKQVAEARICGIVCRSQGATTETDSAAYPALGKPLGGFARLLLRILHAAPWPRSGAGLPDSSALELFHQREGIPIVRTSDWSTPEVQEFVQELQPNLGIHYSTEALDAAVCSIPQKGFLGIALGHGPRTGAVRRGAEHESSCQQLEVRIHVHRLNVNGSQGPRLSIASFPVEPYDTPSSLHLKSELLCRDLLIQGVADLTRQESSAAASPRNTETQNLPERPGLPAVEVPNYPVVRNRPVWKLLLRFLVLGPYVLVRNWTRRLRGRFPVIILYHHLVADRPHRMGMPTDLFLRHVRFLKEYYEVVSLPEAIRRLQSGQVKAPTVVLTFDDGYSDNFLSLRAVAEVEGVPATHFVCTENITRHKEFDHDVKRSERGFFPMSWEQIALLAENGFDFGSHTRTHFDCGSRDVERLQEEIEGSRLELEARLGKQVHFFSFPWGNPQNMSPEAVAAARQSYAHLFSACGGENFPDPDVFLWHLKRRCHANDLWELELALQGILELESLGSQPILEDNFA